MMMMMMMMMTNFDFEDDDAVNKVNSFKGRELCVKYRQMIVMKTVQAVCSKIRKYPNCGNLLPLLLALLTSPEFEYHVQKSVCDKDIAEILQTYGRNIAHTIAKINSEKCHNALDST